MLTTRPHYQLVIFHDYVKFLKASYMYYNVLYNNNMLTSIRYSRRVILVEGVEDFGQHVRVEGRAKHSLKAPRLNLLNINTHQSVHKLHQQ